PTHNVEAPLTMPAFRTGTTVTLADALAVPHGVVEVYLIVAVPAVIPVTTPVIDTDATALLLLLQLPPLRPLLLNVAIELIQTVEAPLTIPAFGSGFTVIILVALGEPQLFVTMYVIVAFPADTPVTTPVTAFTVATDGVTLPQVPPLV